MWKGRLHIQRRRHHHTPQHRQLLHAHVQLHAHPAPWGGTEGGKGVMMELTRKAHRH
ncbi:hypothetical protein E2C01_099933 [Portunus trituberculatus]|uniref:Uncharacterized protein n=1 Tax=Portunus trituberculatus TaxID=210409 RepID=A0A5B7KC03_PORTR|nr:hypothetical protein [Portunus trituberculatus]